VNHKPFKESQRQPLEERVRYWTFHHVIVPQISAQPTRRNQRIARAAAKKTITDRTAMVEDPGVGSQFQMDGDLQAFMATCLRHISTCTRLGFRQPALCLLLILFAPRGSRDIVAPASSDGGALATQLRASQNSCHKIRPFLGAIFAAGRNSSPNKMKVKLRGHHFLTATVRTADLLLAHIVFGNRWKTMLHSSSWLHRSTMGEGMRGVGSLAHDPLIHQARTKNRCHSGLPATSAGSATAPDVVAGMISFSTRAAMPSTTSEPPTGADVGVWGGEQPTQQAADRDDVAAFRKWTLNEKDLKAGQTCACNPLPVQTIAFPWGQIGATNSAD